MDSQGKTKKSPKRVPASLHPEALDQLCDLIFAKLEVRNLWWPAFQAGCRGFESRLPLHKAGWQPASVEMTKLQI